MPNEYRLYRAPMPRDSIRNTDEKSESKLSKQGFLAGGSNVEPVSGGPSDLELSVQYRGLYADRLALSLRELLSSQNHQALTLSGVGGETETDGYYAVSSESSGRLKPQSDRLVGVSASLARRGTRWSHRRAVSINLSQPSPGNVFGNGLTAPVGVPSSATRVKWYNDTMTESAGATPIDTVDARFGGVDLYDAADAPDGLGDDPVIAYKSAGYNEEGDVDVGVWDTYGAAEPTDVNGIVQWGRVFNPGRQPRGDDELVVENGLVRLWLQDGPDDDVRADEWDQGAGAWSPISLPASDWQLIEADMVDIGAASVEAQCVFKDAVSGDEYALDMRLERGRGAPQWLIPNSVTDPPPTALEDLLDPIADGSIYHTGASLDLVDRQKLRK